MDSFNQEELVKKKGKNKATKKGAKKNTNQSSSEINSSNFNNNFEENQDISSSKQMFDKPSESLNENLELLENKNSHPKSLGSSSQNKKEENSKKKEFEYSTDDFHFKIITKLLDYQIQFILEDIDPCSIPKFTYSNTYTHEELVDVNKFFILTEDINEDFQEINNKLLNKNYKLELRENSSEDFERIYLVMDTFTSKFKLIEFKIPREEKDSDYIIKELCRAVNDIYKNVKKLNKETKTLKEDIEKAQEDNEKIDKEIEELIKPLKEDELKEGEAAEGNEENKEEQEKQKEEEEKKQV